MDREKLKNLVDEGYITIRKHPTAELYIYNYTAKCQFEKKWTDETLQCRGLIMDDFGNIVARPFPKFFNLEEYTGVIPDEPFEVYDKLDGSLGILYWIAGRPYIATRGSFTSDQARKATRIFNEKYGSIAAGLNKNYTYLFEIIYPENRIVVNYGDTEDLVLLAVIDTETGIEAPYEELQNTPFDYVVDRHEGITDPEKLKELDSNNKEGFVIRYQSGLRLKVKFDEYVRLHRVMTGLDERKVWEYMKKGVPLSEVIKDVPDEFYNEIIQLETKLSLKRNVFENLVREYFEKIPTEFESDDIREIRKAQANFINKEIPTKLRGLMFAKLNGKSIEDAIWDMVYPEYCHRLNCGFKNVQAGFCLTHYRTVQR